MGLRFLNKILVKASLESLVGVGDGNGAVGKRSAGPIFAGAMWGKRSSVRARQRRRNIFAASPIGRRRDG